MNKTLKLGYILAFLTVFSDAFYDVIVRAASVKWYVQPMVFVSVVYISAAFALLLFGKKGTLGIKTIFQWHTWAFSLLNIQLSFIFLFLFQHISTTEGNFLVRICSVLSIPILFVFLKRKFTINDILSAVLIAIGYTIIIFDAPANVRINVIILSLLYALILVLRSIIGEIHPTNNEAKTIKDRSKTTGAVMLVTGSIYFAISILGAFIKTPENTGIIWDIIPSFADFMHQPTIIGAIILGFFIQSFATFCFFYTTVTAKTEIYLAMTVILPFLTLLIEWFLDYIGYMPIPSLSNMDILGGIIITIGGIYTMIMRRKEQNNL